jgi:hypothetical protein
MVVPVTVTTQVPVPAHPPPDHPTNVEPVAAVAESVTIAPDVSAALQTVPQLMVVPSDDTTVPLPLPAGVTEIEFGAVVNVAVSDTGPETVTVHVPVPVQLAPDHPLRSDPLAGVAVSVTIVPAANVPVQVLPVHVMG